MTVPYDWVGFDPEPDDPDFYVTENSRCSGCGHWFDESEIETLGFVVEEGGVQPSSESGPAVHWATGYIVCPNCGVQLPYEVSSERRTAVRIYPGGRQEVRDTVAALILSVDAAIEQLDRGFYVYIDALDLMEFKQKWKPFNPFATTTTAPRTDSGPHERR